MDQRCLYGHRVPEHFSFAVQQRICPTCGSPSVSLDGYRLARRLTQEVPLEALTAFNVVRVLEGSYALTPLPVDGVEAAPEPEDREPAQDPPSGGTQALPIAAPPKADLRKPAAAVAPPSLGGADIPPPRRRATPPARPADLEDPDSVEKDFFREPGGV